MGYEPSQGFADDLADLIGTTNSNLDVAIDLASRGFRVFPITRKSSGDWTPIVGWLERATRDSDVIRRLWAVKPEPRVGLPGGVVNGITVLDIDAKNGKDGFASLRKRGFDPETLSPVMVRTPNGGAHLFLAHVAGLGNSASKIGPGIDVRNDGGYVVAPGSWKDGRRYEPMGEPLGAVPLPAFPAPLIPPPVPEREAPEPLGEATDEQREWAVEKLASDAAELSEMEEGGRNYALNALAMWAGGAAAHGFLTEEQAAPILWEAAEASGLRLREFNATFRSGWRAGLERPIAEFPREVDWEAVLAAADGESIADDDLLGPADSAASGKASAEPLFRDVADWDGRPVPERQWLVRNLIPMGTVTLLYGDGGNGKSLLALQLAAAVASGDPWLGKPVREGKAMFLSAEDSEDELHRRMADVANADGNSLASYRGKLLVRSMVDGNPLLATLDKTHVLKPSALYKELRAAVEAEQPAVLVLDTLGNLFPGNENDRAQVTLFAALLKRLAERSGCAVFLLAHPSKSGMSTGSGDSGSTAWNGNVRSRLYLDKVLIDGVEVNPKLRRLTHLKANYGPRAEPMVLEWNAGVFRDGSGAVEESASQVAAKFLELVAVYEGKALHPRTGTSYAPKVLADDPRSGGFTKAQFRTAMGALFDSGRIAVATGRTPKGDDFVTIRVVEDGPEAIPEFPESLRSPSRWN